MFYKSHLNCLELIIASILEDFGFPYVTYFKHAGFMLYENKYNPKDILLYSKDEKDRDLLQSNYGIQLTNYQFLRVNDYFNMIDNLLNMKETKVTLKVDDFELPYSFLYKSEHNFHAIVITNKRGQDYFINDYFYKFSGWVDKKFLWNAINSVNDHIPTKKPEILVFQKKIKNAMNIQIKDSIEKNIEIMRGQSNIKVSDSLFNEYKRIEGFKGINRLFEYILNSLKDKDVKTLDYIATIISYTANSRMQFSEFLEFNQKNELSEYYKDSYQNWSVLKNLILKSILSNNFEGLEKRVKLRMDKVENIERICILESERHLMVDPNTVK